MRLIVTSKRMTAMRGSRILDGAGFGRCQASGSQARSEFERFGTRRGSDVRLQTVDQDNQKNQTQELEILHDDT